MTKVVDAFDVVTARMLRRMIAAAVAGLAIALGALGGANALCTGSASALCKAGIQNPPWLLLSGVAAAPVVLLTWYWRTVHKERDLRATSISQDLSRMEHVTARFATAVAMIDKGGMSAVGGIYALDRVARDSVQDHWAIIETLCALLRGSVGMKGGEFHAAMVQAAVTVIGRRDASRDPVGSQIRLRGADLQGADFSDLNFAGADFVNAFVSGCRFHGTNLSGANLHVQMATGELPVYDKDTNFGDGAAGVLNRDMFRANGARDIDELRRVLADATEL
ncbi:MAG TPA: pentapeptide repeat-containing protein [Polyangiaceae bacterium]|nr:pentapeptide repeat-containing protein [Polyangiaceae bacterium]